MTMNAQPDVLGAPAAGRTAYAATLKERASRLLIVNRLRTNTVRVSACYAVERLLGSAWVPVRPIEEDARFEQALCAWWNSTPGILTLLNDRGKTLDYARFALGTLRSLLVPNPSTVDIEATRGGVQEYANASTYGMARDGGLPKPARTRRGRSAGSCTSMDGQSQTGEDG